ncbi:hypothetical protein, conserved, partial [Eimeria maxima]
VFLCVRVLLLRLPLAARTPVWPIVMTELIRVFSGALSSSLPPLAGAPPPAVAAPLVPPAAGDPVNMQGTPLSLLSAGVKVVELATLLDLPDFSLYRWVFLADDSAAAAAATAATPNQQYQHNSRLPTLLTKSKQQPHPAALVYANQQQLQRDILVDSGGQSAPAAAAEGAAIASHDEEIAYAETDNTRPVSAAAAAGTAAAGAAQITGGVVCVNASLPPVESPANDIGGNRSSSSSRRSSTTPSEVSTINSSATFRPFLSVLEERYEEQQHQRQGSGGDLDSVPVASGPHESPDAGNSSNSSSSLAAAARRLNQRAAAEPIQKIGPEDEEIRRSIEDDLLEGPEELRDLWCELPLQVLLQRQWCLYTSGFELLLPAAAGSGPPPACGNQEF